MCVALVSAAGFAFVYLLFAHTAHGLAFDAKAFARASGDAPSPYRVAGQRTLQTIDVGTVAAVLVLLSFLALVRGEVRRAAVAAVVTVAPVATAELLKRALPFPAGRPPTLPSGHTAVAVSFGFALVIAVPPLLRATAAFAGAAYGAAIAFAVIVLGWHYPSDAAASFFLCGLWVSVVGLRLRSATARPTVSGRGLVLAIAAVAAALAVAAAIASRRPARRLRSRRSASPSASSASPCLPF